MKDSKNIIEQKHQKILNKRSASEYLSISERTLEGMRKSGTGPKFVRISSRGIRYRLKDINDASSTPKIRKSSCSQTYRQ